MPLPLSNRQSGRLVPLAAVLLVLAAFGAALYMLTAPPAAPEKATVLNEGAALPAFDLVAGDGSEFTRDSFKGRWSWLFFGFTHCPDICPATLYQLSVARGNIGGDESPGIVFVSVDPERDTIEAVSDYTSAFGDDVVGVTGSLEEIEKLTRPLGIYHARVPDSADTYLVEHSAAVLLINPNAEM